ncbi:MAG: hypothetical protein HYZ11_02095 [Candidatus Tectomicrobia bacterium]|uniref:Uncharacterized protein n=1 Tax=Tectimicrobiota bacterium TaxID=2528274 RepID=A0A932HXS7_UNCTE|nr:hypothetical protein [Candidatus Tectomicrobia bacterium]
MSTLTKAKELLTEIDSQINSLSRELKTMRAQRSDAARMVKRLGSVDGGGRRGPKAGGRRGPRGKRTNWNQVLASMSGTFSLNDLSKASGKSKLTVSQAVQKMKKEKKIAATAKRGVYKKA